MTGKHFFVLYWNRTPASEQKRKSVKNDGVGSIVSIGLGPSERTTLSVKKSREWGCFDAAPEGNH